MSIAIISDIHANQEALQAVLESIQSRQIEGIYCLGDIVGYGPNPNECVELIHSSCKHVLVGNHDYAAVNKTDIAYFNKHAKAAAVWTRKALSSKHKKYLLGLKLTHQNDDLLMVHASPANPEHWYYVLSPYDASVEMQAYNQPVCFVGHSHIPVIFTAEQEINKTKIKLKPEQKYLINVGSVGQPRDGNPKACYCIYNPETREVEYVRVAYDIEKTYSKIISAGLPAFLAERLLKGY